MPKDANVAKRNEQRADVHKTILAYANRVRCSLDGWDFKNYLLTMMLYRFLSEEIIARLSDDGEGDEESFDYTTYPDAEVDQELVDELVGEVGYFIYPSQLFSNVYASAKGDEDLNVKLEETFRAIEGSSAGTSAEEDFKGIFTEVDFQHKGLGGTPAEKSRMIFDIMDIIAQMDAGDFTEQEIDSFGDTYEKLMSYYASQAGKSGGEYYTPQEVGKLIARIVIGDKKRLRNFYDPTCGSAGLPLAAVRQLGVDKVGKIYGQEKNPTTHMLARANLIMHHINYSDFDIEYGDTLKDPKHLDMRFEAIGANPPYSAYWDSDEYAPYAADPRFTGPGVLAPPKYADLAFTLHMLYQLADDGVACIVEFPGVLYRDKREKAIRKYLVENDFVDAVIQLPENLFFGTSIATCLLVLKKDRTSTDKVCFINASEMCQKATNSNVLTDDDIEKIYKLYSERENVEYECRMVNKEEIADKDYVLSVSSYVESKTDGNDVNISELNDELAATVERTNALRTALAEIIADIGEAYAQAEDETAAIENEE